MKELDTDDKTRERERDDKWITSLKKGDIHDVSQSQDADHRSQTQISSQI